MTIVDQFNEDPDVFVFLISVMAGGVGLNLVSANKVIIFDPSWSMPLCPGYTHKF